MQNYWWEFEAVDGMFNGRVREEARTVGVGVAVATGCNLPAPAGRLSGPLPVNSEFTFMDLHHFFDRIVCAKLVEWETRRELGKLSDRALADIGILRGDIRAVAQNSSRRVAAQSPVGAANRQVDAIPVGRVLGLRTG